MLLNLKGKKLFQIAFFLFILSAFYGLLLRYNFAFPIKEFAYKNFLQAHSHVAFLGWGYIAVIGAIIQCFVSVENSSRKTYSITLAVILVTILLMFISFPATGYKAFSIVLLCLFGVTSYVLSFRLLKDIKGSEYSVKLIRYGIYYYLLSSLATWFLAFVLVSQGKINLYYNTVYFYLHFLYNGFFVFALFGLLFKLFEFQQISLSKSLQRNFFIYLNIACIPAYFLSVLWSTEASVFYVLGFAASVFQLISLVFLWKLMFQVFEQIKWSFISKLLLKFSLVAYSLKIIAQFFSSFPYIVQKSIALKPFFIIGYLHLFTLGFMSVFIILILNELHKIHLKRKSSIIGMYLFLAGVLISEVLLFLQGFLILFQLKIISNFQISVFIASVFMVVGLLILFVSQFLKPSKVNS